MNCRERVFRAIKFEYPDRVPIVHAHLAGALLRHGRELINLYKKYPNDFYNAETVIKIPERDLKHYDAEGRYYKEETDEWGCVFAYFQEGLAGEVKKSPLDDWSALKRYKLPPVPSSSPEGRKRAKEDMKKMKEKYIGWGAGGSLYERMQWLRGVENLMVDIALDREEVYLLADRMLTEYLLPTIEISLESGAEIIGFGDDWGAQNQLLINPRSWRKIFKPRYKRLFDLARQGNALTYMHSDGMILEIIPDLIEIGLNVVNPQFSCFDLNKLKDATRKKICVSSDIDRQKTLPFGTSEEVEKYVKEVFDIFVMPEGGFIARGEVGPDVPLENVEAMLKSFYKYGCLVV
ncbi:MAG: uroporphyrinogen decarboxylase family protein [Kiritimatiellia bacterium]|nr:uroporphyrinogen decarboxylase family protein [Kiritimatiellia bacterium]